MMLFKDLLYLTHHALFKSCGLPGDPSDSKVEPRPRMNEVEMCVEVDIFHLPKLCFLSFWFNFHLRLHLNTVLWVSKHPNLLLFLRTSLRHVLYYLPAVFSRTEPQLPTAVTYSFTDLHWLPSLTSQVLTLMVLPGASHYPAFESLF